MPILIEPMPNQTNVEPTTFELHGHERHAYPNTSAKNTNRPSYKLSKGDMDIGFKNKRAGRLISRRLQNNSNSHVSSIKMIEVHESSNSKIKRFLSEEDPPCLKPDLGQAYNFIDNFPPCLKHSQGFPGIKFDKKPIGNSGDILAHDCGYSQIAITDSRCEVCLFWVNKYYADIPTLQLQIKTLTTQIDSLKDKNHRLKYGVQR